MIKLSIIIPYFNTYSMTDKLLTALFPQTDDRTEIIMVDDGSEEPFIFEEDWKKVKYIRKDNGGVSSARNRGLQEAKGEYIVFIDSDDMVSDDYIEQIYKAIKTKPDTVYISWKSMDGRFGKTIISENDKFGPKNRCVWNRVFKKTYIKDMEFNEKMPVAEDDDFLNRLPKAESHTFISKPIYFYRVGREDGLSMRKARGEFDDPEIITQVVLYYSWVQQIGGVETFFYNFCEKMSEYYDIAILYDRCDRNQIRRLQRFAPCYHNGDHKIMCDTLILNGIFDKIPQKVTSKCKIRLVHTCKYEKFKILEVPNDCDRKIFVSEASMRSFGEDGTVIPNIPGNVDSKKALVLISATRLTAEKGYERMIKLANKLKKNKIPFVWFVFTAKNDRDFPEGFVKCPPTLDIKPYLLMADYLVQLSDIEAFCYSIQEALQLKKPVLTTPIETLDELGLQNNKNGYILPYNIDEMTDLDIKKIYNKIPKFKDYVCDTDFIINQWKEILGDTVPTHSYHYDESLVEIKCKVRFRDLTLNRIFVPGDVQTVDEERARYLVEELKAWNYV